jgi:Tfp pilus assembly protein PilN
MIKINLLPYREKRKEVHTKREGLALFLTIALFLLLFGAVHLYMVQSLDKLRAEVRKSDNELKKLAQITMDIGKFKKNCRSSTPWTTTGWTPSISSMS